MLRLILKAINKSLIACFIFAMLLLLQIFRQKYLPEKIENLNPAIALALGVVILLYLILFVLRQVSSAASYLALLVLVIIWIYSIRLETYKASFPVALVIFFLPLHLSFCAMSSIAQKIIFSGNRKKAKQALGEPEPWTLEHIAPFFLLLAACIVTLIFHTGPDLLDSSKLWESLPFLIERLCNVTVEEYFSLLIWALPGFALLILAFFLTQFTSFFKSHSVNWFISIVYSGFAYILIAAAWGAIQGLSIFLGLLCYFAFLLFVGISFVAFHFSGLFPSLLAPLCMIFSIVFIFSTKSLWRNNIKNISNSLFIRYLIGYPKFSRTYSITRVSRSTKSVGRLGGRAIYDNPDNSYSPPSTSKASGWTTRLELSHVAEWTPRWILYAFAMFSLFSWHASIFKDESISNWHVAILIINSVAFSAMYLTAQCTWKSLGVLLLASKFLSTCFAIAAIPSWAIFYILASTLDSANNLDTYLLIGSSSIVVVCAVYGYIVYKKYGLEIKKQIQGSDLR